jgi:hypothetical protein
MRTSIRTTSGQRHSTFVRPDFSPADAGFVGFAYGQLCLVVFAVLIVAGEYTSGSIRSSLIAVPVRGLLYSGRLLVLAAVAFTVSLVTAFVSYDVSEQALGPIGVSLRTSGVAQAILGAAAYVTLICVFSAAVAFLLRSSARALGLLLPLHLVVPTIMANIPGLKTAGDYLPSQAGAQAMQVVKQGASTLTPGSGLLVLAAWTAAATLGGFVCLRVRDA